MHPNNSYLIIWRDTFSEADLNTRLRDRIEKFADLWVKTPYMNGQRVRGVGVSCAELAIAFLDDMARRTEPTKIPRFGGDSSQHSPDAGLGVMKAIMSSHPLDLVQDNSIEPGDMLLVGVNPQTREDRPAGHAMIALPRPATLLHAVPEIGVTRTSVGAANRILKVFRPQEKITWVS